MALPTNKGEDHSTYFGSAVSNHPKNNGCHSRRERPQFSHWNAREMGLRFNYHVSTIDAPGQSCSIIGL